MFVEMKDTHHHQRKVPSDLDALDEKPVSMDSGSGKTKAKEETNYFICNSTAHGISRIFDKKHGAIRRFLWAVFFVTSLTFLVMMMKNSYYDILRRPFKTVSSLKKKTSLPFPALTVCNVNPVDLTRLPPGTAAVLDRAMMVMDGDGSTTNGSLQFSQGNLTLGMEIIEVTERGYIPVEEFLQTCRYGNLDNNGPSEDCVSLFSPFRLGMDSCYMLNPDNLSRHATDGTALQLTIFLNLPGYMSFVNTLGVKFHVHAQGDVPSMETSSRYVAGPGFTTNVALRLQENKFLPSPYKAFEDSECVDTDSEDFRPTMDGPVELYPGSRGQSYSLDACMLLKRYELAAPQCNCTVDLTSDVVPGWRSSYPPCTLEAMTCLSEANYRLLDKAASSGDTFGCPRPCHTFTYEPTISSLYFPSPAYRGQQLPHFNESDKMNHSEYRKNYLQLKFYFENLMIYETKHVPEYDEISIMGLLGGNMGFFLGASVLTLAEVLDFLVCFLGWTARAVWRRCRARSATSVDDVGYTDTSSAVDQKKTHKAWE